jgi:hypothetical protein
MQEGGDQGRVSTLQGKHQVIHKLLQHAALTGPHCGALSQVWSWLSITLRWEQEWKVQK